MPTTNQMNAACQQGDNARAQVDAGLLDAAAPQQPPAPRPQDSTATTATATTIRRFSDAFGSEDDEDSDQDSSSDRQPPAVNSRTGQRVNVSVANGPVQRVTTDAHARVVAPTNRRQVEIQQRRRHRHRRATPQPNNANNANDANNATGADDANHAANAANNPDDVSIPSDVQDELDAAAQEENAQLWDDDAIDADIAKVIKSRIAPMSRKTYNDYTVRFIIFLFDQQERFPNLIRADLLGILQAAHVGSGGVIEEETVEFTIKEECVLQEQARDAALKEKTKALIENRKKNGLTVGLHNGILTPILPTYKLPQMNIVQMMNLFLVGVRCEHVPPFRILKPCHVKKFDKRGKRLFDMRKCMGIIEKIARRKGVWRPHNAGDGYWNGRTVQMLWDGVCDEILPHLATKTKLPNGDVSLHKSRGLSLQWRTAFRKLEAAGLKSM